MSVQQPNLTLSDVYIAIPIMFVGVYSLFGHLGTYLDAHGTFVMFVFGLITRLTYPPDWPQAGYVSYT